MFSIGCGYARAAGLFVGVLAVMSGSSAGADPQMFISDSTNTLWRVDLATGQADAVGPTNGQLSDIAFAPDGRLFGVTFDYLYEVDPHTGWSTLIGRHGFRGPGFDYGIDALTFYGDGTLYAAGHDVLISIDTATGVGTRIADLGGHRSAGDLTIDALGRLLMPTDEGLLVEILRDGSGVNVLTTLPYDDFYAMGTTEDGTVYGIRPTNRIYTIDPVTGATQAGPSLHADQLIGRAWGGSVPNVHFPEPATAALLMIGAAVVILPRRARHWR